MRVLFALLACLSAGAVAAQPAEVVVLATLHQFHADNPGYDYGVLRDAIRALAPDAIAVELTAADLAGRRPQAIKREYPETVYPLLDEGGIDAIALEPDQPLYDELVGRFREGQRALAEQHPGRAEAFGIYGTAVYDFLFAHWTSLAAVNDAPTDAVLDSKHRFQAALFGEPEVAAWEGWNGHFLARILDAARERPGQRILVLVGVEHAYWLRRELARASSLRLRAPMELLPARFAGRR